MSSGDDASTTADPGHELDKGSEKPNAKLPPKYPLALSSKPGHWVCDGCKRSSRKASDTRRYGCTQGRNFDFCHDCFVASGSEDAGPQPEVAARSITAPADGSKIGPKTPEPESIREAFKYTDKTLRKVELTDDAGQICVMIDKVIRGKWNDGNWRDVPPEIHNSLKKWLREVKAQLPHKHPMELCTGKLATSHFYCDACKRWSRRLGDKRRYRCSMGCDFDLCHGCFTGSGPEETNDAGEQPAFAPRSISAPIEKLPRAKVPERILSAMVASHPIKGRLDHEHALVPSTNVVVHWSCDGCSRTSRRHRDMLDVRYLCGQGCNFDLCSECYARRPFSADDLLGVSYDDFENEEVLC